MVANPSEYVIKICSVMEVRKVHVTRLVQLLPSQVEDTLLMGVSHPKYPILFVRVLDGADQEELARDAVKAALEALKEVGMLSPEEKYAARVWEFADRDNEPDYQFNEEETAGIQRE